MKLGEKRTSPTVPSAWALLRVTKHHVCKVESKQPSWFLLLPFTIVKHKFRSEMLCSLKSC
jgi:hypothetical protein